MINYLDEQLYTKAEIDPYAERIDEAYNAATEASQVTEALEGDVEDLYTQIGQLQASMAQLQEEMSALRAIVETISSDVGGLLKIRGTARYITQDKIDMTFTQVGLWHYVDGAWVYIDSIEEGDVYNIDSDFTTDTSFVEGTGLEVVAGTNIVAINEGTESVPNIKLDVMALSIAAVDISAETAAREAADQALQTLIEQEVQNRQTAVTQVQSNVTIEAQERADADSNLQDNIDAEEAARTLADSELQGKIDALDESQLAYWYGSKTDFETAKTTLDDDTLVLSPDDLSEV